MGIFHLNILFLLGLALFGGTIGGRIFQKLRIPQVVGYIAIGIIIGESGVRVVNRDIITALQPFNYFALGLIGFMVGGELKKEIFAKYGKQFMTILLCEGIAPFLLVSLIVGIVGTFLLGDWRLAWALGLLLGAIASATDPATSTEVLREYKTRGPLTQTILSIVALDDGLALLLFVIASSVAGTLSAGVHAGGLLRSFINPAYEIFGSLIVGTITGLVFSKIIRRYSEKGRLLAFSIGTVLLITGLSLALNIELLLTAMTAGVVVVNLAPRKSREIFELIGGFTPPIYVLFFVFIGAKLNLQSLTLATAVLGGIYLFGTMVGKAAGARFGAVISGAPESVKKYLPLGLFSQAGVAIGLSILATQYFPGEIGNTLVIIITATTFILQLVGPYFVKVAVTGAAEIGLDITEEDIIQASKATDLMDKNTPVIYKNTPLAEILEIFSESPNLYYPVTDKEKNLLGIITVDNIKNIFNETSLSGFFLAYDLMEPVVAKVNPQTPMREVQELLDRHNLECLPVVTYEDNKLAGFIERRNLDKAISTKIIELKKKADSLGAS
ncbi:MAG: cation:proton antiporter [Candidatus Omnitrophota bacterium]